MVTCGENYNNWLRTTMTRACLLVAFAPDGATGNNDDDFIDNCFLSGFFNKLNYFVFTSIKRHFLDSSFFELFLEPIALFDHCEYLI